MAFATRAPSMAAMVQLPLMGRLFNALEEEQRLVVVDLGVALPSLLEALQPYRVRLDAIACAEHIPVWLAQETQEEREALISDHFARFNLEQADWVLCWTMLNYLDAPTLGALAHTLGQCLKPTTRIHALIEYSSQTMPAEPQVCRICFDDHKPSLDQPPQGGDKATPRFTPKRLEGMLGGLRTQNTILLSNGMQEYVFAPA